MMTSRDPDVAIKLLHEYDLLKLLYDLRSRQKNKDKALEALIHKSVELSRIAKQVLLLFSVSDPSIASKELKLRLFYATMVYQFSNFSLPSSGNLAKYILRQSLARPKDLTAQVGDICLYTQRYIDFLDTNSLIMTDQDLRVNLGLFLKDAKPFWNHIKVLSVAVICCQE